MMPPTMPDPQPDPIRATLCRRCKVRPVAGEICAECEARPSVHLAVEGDWVRYQFQEGEGYPDDRAGLSRVSAAMRRQDRLDTLIAPLCGMAIVALLLLLLWSWVTLGRAAVAAAGLYPAPQSEIRGGAR